MNDSFYDRVYAAAVAGWWTVLIAIGFTTFLWLVYLATITWRPAWMLAMFGPDITWPEVQHIMLCAVVAFKFLVWMLVLAVTWLSLWARQLRS